jgi:septin family protein
VSDRNVATFGYGIAPDGGVQHVKLRLEVTDTQTIHDELDADGNWWVVVQELRDGNLVEVSRTMVKR